MRDIRSDLKERLDAVASERQKAQEQLASLESQEAHIKALLAAENARWHSVEPGLFAAATSKSNGRTGDTKHSAIAKVGRTPLSSLILECLVDGKPHSTKEIAEKVAERGFPFGDKNPVRAVHFALVGMKQNKAIESVGKSVYRRREIAAMT